MVEAVSDLRFEPESKIRLEKKQEYFFFVILPAKCTNQHVYRGSGANTISCNMKPRLGKPFEPITSSQCEGKGLGISLRQRVWARKPP